MSLETVPLADGIEMVADPVIEADGQCAHVMALHIDPRSEFHPGVIRCIVKRTGSVHVSGYVDWSRIHTVEMDSRYEARLGPELHISGAEEVVSDLAGDSAYDFLGFEDPNIWCRPEAETVHLYYTIPFFERYSGDICFYLGHAEGPDVASLTMTEPVLGPVADVHSGAKEVAIAPRASDGTRYNLVESNDTRADTSYSVLRTAIAQDLSGPWELGDLAFHPAEDGYDWCRGHVSPGPFLPCEFLDPGVDRVVGLLNGRGANHVVDGKIRYGEFDVGLLVYDYERGDVEWISDEPILRDPDAETITFASAFRQIEPNRGVLYAHVDDSYVRAYLVDADALAPLLP
jgi:hypothetical protein